MFSALVLKKERPTTVTILVDRELRTKLERAASASERSLGAEVRVALKRHLGEGAHDVCDAPPIVTFSGF